MNLLPDTSVLIGLLRGERAVVDAWESLAEGGRIFLSPVVEFELHVGFQWAGKGWQEAEWQAASVEMEVLPFDDHAARHAAQLLVAMKRRGAALGMADCLIAGTAAARDLVLVTADERLAQVAQVGVPVRLVSR